MDAGFLLDDLMNGKTFYVIFGKFLFEASASKPPTYDHNMKSRTKTIVLSLTNELQLIDQEKFIQNGMVVIIVIAYGMCSYMSTLIIYMYIQILFEYSRTYMNAYDRHAFNI